MPSPSRQDPPLSWSELRRDGVELVAAHPSAGLPRVAHWGTDLGELTAADLSALDAATSRQSPPATLDAAWRLTWLLTETEG